MLNPSTADESVNDPTVERCERRAREWGYGALEVVNIFAIRSTDPSLIRKVDHPIGELNDEAIRDSAARSQLVICAWGNEGEYLHRGATVLSIILNEARRVPHALKINEATRQPAHPLYLRYDLKPFAMETKCRLS